MNVALGDHQVTNYQADVEARTIGAKIHTPVVYDGRWPDFDVAWNIPRSDAIRTRGSAIVYWDGGPSGTTRARRRTTCSAPTCRRSRTCRTRTGNDPHGLPRRRAAEQQMVSDFLPPNAPSHITDTCNGQPCFDFNFDGP